MRFGAIVLAYNQEEYISYCLRALAPHVAHVVVVFSELPWTAYNPRAREMLALADDTGAHLTALQRELSNLTVIEGVWSREEDMRNAGLSVVRTLGVDVCLVLDADEFYPEGGLRQLKLEIERRNTPGRRYYVPYLACFKRVDHLLETQQNGSTASVMRAAAAVPLDHDTRFYRWRHRFRRRTTSTSASV